MALPPHVMIGMMLYQTALRNKTGMTHTQYCLLQLSSPFPFCRLSCKAPWETPSRSSQFLKEIENQLSICSVAAQAKVLPTGEHKFNIWITATGGWNLHSNWRAALTEADDVSPNLSVELPSCQQQVSEIWGLTKPSYNNTDKTKIIRTV